MSYTGFSKEDNKFFSSPGIKELILEAVSKEKNTRQLYNNVGKFEEDIVNQVEERRKTIQSLKENSSYWPRVYKQKEIVYDPLRREKVYLSSLVRILREGKWYIVHAVEDCWTTEDSEIEYKTFLRLCDSVHKITHLYKLCNHEDLDKLQISEEERFNQ